MNVPVPGAIGRGERVRFWLGGCEEDLNWESEADRGGEGTGHLPQRHPGVRECGRHRPLSGRHQPGGQEQRGRGGRQSGRSGPVSGRGSHLPGIQPRRS